MPEAARLTDRISHTSALAGLIGGAILGAVVGAAIAFSGGAAALAIGFAAASGASLGGMIGEFIGSLLSFDTGAITGICSFNVITCGLLAARAIADFAMCSGMGPVAHPNSVIAQGSLTVFINNLPAARKTDKLVCGAAISSGCRSVIIGGEDAGTFLPIESEVPAWLEVSLIALGIVGGAGLLRLAGLTWVSVTRVLGAGFFGSEFGGAFFGWLGAGIFGKGSTGQKIMGFLGSLLGGAVAGRAAYRGAPRMPPDPATVARTGPMSEVQTNRRSEWPYRNPDEMHTVRPGNSPPELDPNKKYLWVVDEDGNVLIAPEEQPGFGRAVKHGDLTPGPDGQSRGPARTGGELNFNKETGKWEMDNNSSYAFNRADGNTSNIDNIDATKDLMGKGGMDTSNIETVDFLEGR
jgi:uncharacterized Zn-binding protein involved in type VI secretion